METTSLSYAYFIVRTQRTPHSESRVRVMRDLVRSFQTRIISDARPIGRISRCRRELVRNVAIKKSKRMESRWAYDSKNYDGWTKKLGWMVSFSQMTLERGDWVGKWQICFRENSENVRPKVVGNKRFWCRRHGKYTHRTDHAYGIIRTATYFQSNRWTTLSKRR